MDLSELEFFSGKKVFITGHTGFKGAWLTQIMIRSNALVCGYSLPNLDHESHFEGMGLKNLITHIEGDIRDEIFLSESMSAFQPDIVFHLAAQALVKPAYIDPVDTFSTNVMGSLNVLQAVKKCDSVKSMVYVTSDKCYENVEWEWGYRETDELGGHDPYSSSKAAAEIVFSSYTRSFYKDRTSLGTASVRAGNVIGGGDFSLDRIVPDCIRAIRKNNPIELRNPQSTRPWQHVLEPLSGYILLAQKLFENPLKYSDSWNFGPGSQEPRNVGEVAQKIVDQYGKGSILLGAVPSDFHEANLLQLNCDRAHHILGWKPRWDVEKTLNITAEWYRLVDSGSSMQEVTNTHINDYFGESND
ncbi:CDP-glucose 4,6-dehydratase [Gammaproteobacteria bacterium]|nr:CDP-glucose 4,6-dehydratase [Gammaproteobacteria bacterium]